MHLLAPQPSAFFFFIFSLNCIRSAIRHFGTLCSTCEFCFLFFFFFQQFSTYCIIYMFFSKRTELFVTIYNYRNLATLKFPVPLISCDARLGKCLYSVYRRYSSSICGKPEYECFVSCLATNILIAAYFG